MSLNMDNVGSCVVDDRIFVTVATQHNEAYLSEEFSSLQLKSNCRSYNLSFRSVFFQLCQVVSPTSMLCQAPELPISLARQQEVLEKPDEFGFKLDDVQSLMALNNTNFIYYPNPEFELLSVSGVLELKPGSPIILKVGHMRIYWLFYWLWRYVPS